MSLPYPPPRLALPAFGLPPVFLSGRDFCGYLSGFLDGLYWEVQEVGEGEKLMRTPAISVCPSKRNMNVRFGNAQDGLVDEVKTKTDLETTLKNAMTPVLLKFSAPWCPPCRASKPLAAQIASNNQGKLQVVEVEVSDAQRISNPGMDAVSKQYKIQGIPSFVLIKNGTEAGRIVGADKAGIEKLVKDNV
jgi:thioredoxin 1